VSITPNAVWFMAEIQRTTGGGLEPRPIPLAAVIDRPSPIDPASTRIRFSVPHAGPARLAVYGPAGRPVAVLADRHVEAGEWDAVWDGLDARGARAAAGVYFIHLRGRDFAASRKVLLR
jgi:hypothetical protein